MTKRNIIFNGFLYEAVSNKGFIKDDIIYLNMARLTNTDLSKAVSFLKGADFDVRGIEDLKKLLTRYNIENIDGVDYTKVTSNNWGMWIARAVGIPITPKVEEKIDLLPIFLKNLKNNQDGISIGDSVTSGTAYILPDGRSVNFPARFNVRAYDHRIIGGYIDKDFDSGTTAMEYFMDHTGAIRFIPEQTSFDIRTKPTPIQLSKIEKIVNSAKIDFSLDVYSPEYGRRGKLYSADTPKGAKVKSDILRFYNSGEFGLEHLGA